MSSESDFIVGLRKLVSDPAARGLLDDAAVLDVGDSRLVFTHDMLVESVHYLPSDLPGDVAWKLVAVNLSDLAAKGARPVGLLMGYSLASNPAWDAAFTAGLAVALDHFGVALLGGDTVALPPGAPRFLGLTAIGEVAEGDVPSRAGAKAGDRLWVSGSIGDAGAGLRIAKGGSVGPAALVERYRRPQPRLGAGAALAPIVSAMMDISDGLLIDARRLAAASQIAIEIDLDRIPLSQFVVDLYGDGRAARLDAATAGDDFELLFTAPPAICGRLPALAERLGLPLTAIGTVRSGAGLTLLDLAGPVALPDRLGFEHQAR